MFCVVEAVQRRRFRFCQLEEKNSGLAGTPRRRPNLGTMFGSHLCLVWSVATLLIKHGTRLKQKKKYSLTN